MKHCKLQIVTQPCQPCIIYQPCKRITCKFITQPCQPCIIYQSCKRITCKVQARFKYYGPYHPDVSTSMVWAVDGPVFYNYHSHKRSTCKNPSNPGYILTSGWNGPKYVMDPFSATAILSHCGSRSSWCVIHTTALPRITPRMQCVKMCTAVCWSTALQECMHVFVCWILPHITPRMQCVKMCTAVCWSTALQECMHVFVCWILPHITPRMQCVKMCTAVCWSTALQECMRVFVCWTALCVCMHAWL
jgi:hypothetical protein